MLLRRYVLATLLAVGSFQANAQLNQPTYYPVKGGWINSQGAITRGADEALWFSSASYLGRISLDSTQPDGVLSCTYQLPSDFSGTAALTGITLGSDGNLWFTTNNNGKSFIGQLKVGSVKPHLCPKALAISPYLVPTKDAQSIMIVPATDGNLWFTEADAQRIGRVCVTANPEQGCTATGDITEYPSGASLGAYPWAITAGMDDQLWFATWNENDNSVLIRSMGTNGRLTGLPISLPTNHFVYSMTTGPDGALWFTDYLLVGDTRASYVGRVCIMQTFVGCSHADIGLPHEYPLRSDILLTTAIVPGPDGALWFAGSTASNTYVIGRIPPGAGDSSSIEYASVDAIWGIAPGPDGALWFTGGLQMGHEAPLAVRNGIDLSGGSLVPDDVDSFKDVGVQYAVVKLPQDVPGNSDAEDAAVSLLNTLHGTSEKPGLPVGGYCVLYFSGKLAQSGETQAQNCFNTLTKRNVSLSELAFVAADVEETTSDYPDPCGLIQSALDRIGAVLGPKKALVYTADYFWERLLPNGCPKQSDFTTYPLWLAGLGDSFVGYADGPGLYGCLKNSASLLPTYYSGDYLGVPSSLRPGGFGGWTMKLTSAVQYDNGPNGNLGTCLFGKKVDFDYFDLSLWAIAVD